MSKVVNSKFDGDRHIPIAGHQIGAHFPPFIVAELSANHHQSLSNVLQLVEAVHASGAHAVKLQTYTPDTLTLNRQDGRFFIADNQSLWKGKSLYELYKEAHLPWDWHPPIFERCQQLGMICFSTPFDESAVDFLETLGPPCYKIASLEIIDLPLIRRVAATGKPLLISTGASTLAEIDQAVTVARAGGCQQLVLLKCTSSYPALPEEAHLRTIPHLSAAFDLPVGLSDHTQGIGVALASIALGAVMIEKHVTLSRSYGGVDDAFSIEPHELKALVEEAKRAWSALGMIHYGPLDGERECHGYRPSLYFDYAIPKGTIIHSSHVRSVRPSGGLPPQEIDRIVGLTLLRDVKSGTPVTWDLFQQEL